MKLLIVAGGGGHFAAALAVIQKLPKEMTFSLILRKHAFEGDTALSFEYQTASAMHLPFVVLDTGRLQRKFTMQTILSLCKFPFGIYQAFRIVQKQKPSVVLSFGGYVAVPVTLVAWFLRIPIVIHEQTLQAGMANRIGAVLAKKICISWAQSKHVFPAKKVVFTGLPLQKEKKTAVPAAIKDADKPLVCIIGGSGGSHAINTLVAGGLNQLLQHFTVVHQTGDAKKFHDYEHLDAIKKTLPEELRERYFLYKFIHHDVLYVMLAQAVVVVSRAGMNTVAELIFLEKPSLLIPLPYGQADEQLRNARFMKMLGIAEIANQHTLSSEKLVEQIMQIYENKKKYVLLQKKEFLLPETAAQHILFVVETVVH